VQLSSDGRARVQLAAHEIGTGVMTVVGQIAAERLGVALDQVQVEAGDSRLPPVPVAGGSNQTASCCSVWRRPATHCSQAQCQRRREQLAGEIRPVGVTTL